MPSSPHPAEARELAQRLAAFLRSVWNEPELEYAVSPVRLHGGFDTRVYAFALRGVDATHAVPLVLRLFSANDPPGRAGREAAAQAAVAAAGYPATRVLLSWTEPEPLGAPFIIMERLQGRPMLRELGTLRRLVLDPRSLLGEAAAILADLMARLHRLDSDRFLSVAREAGCDPEAFEVHWLYDALESGLAHAPVDGIAAVWRWLQHHRPSPIRRKVLCHCDLHPMNILMQDGRVTGVVDWANLIVHEPEFDAAQTVMALRLGPLPGPWPLPVLAARFQGRMADRFLDAARGRERLDTGRLRYYEVFRMMLEMAEAGARMAQSPPDPGAWGSPRQTRRLAARITHLTGLTLRVAPV